MINVEKNVSVVAKLTDGTYTCKLDSIADGKTINDTRFNFSIVGGEFDGRKLINFTNNSKVLWTDDNGVEWTSEDFFMNGLARQLCDNGTISYQDVLDKLTNGATVQLYVVHNGNFQNVSSTRPKMVEVCEGLDI